MTIVLFSFLPLPFRIALPALWDIVAIVFECMAIDKVPCPVAGGDKNCGDEEGSKEPPYEFDGLHALTFLASDKRFTWSNRAFCSNRRIHLVVVSSLTLVVIPMRLRRSSRVMRYGAFEV